MSPSTALDPTEIVMPWAERDRDLERKLARLYREHLESWIAIQGDRRFQEKWHVGREMLDWFYSKHLIDADEFERLNVKCSRPSKPGYNVEMYRLVWKESGRSSEQVAQISLAPRTGPSSGYKRGFKSTFESPDSNATSISTIQARLKAEREIEFGSGGWVYAYGYEEDLEQRKILGREPLIKVGYTSNHYAQRIAAQARGTEVPDAPRVLRAYSVSDPARIEAEIHSALKQEDRHHRRAGGSEWFRVTVDRLDEIVEKIMTQRPLKG